MFEMENIRVLISKDAYYYSIHGDQERQKDDLTITEVEEVLLAGRIIEQYDDIGRGESCLVAGFTAAGKPVHIVIGMRGDWIVVVTVYIPRPPKFKTVYERG